MCGPPPPPPPPSCDIWSSDNHVKVNDVVTLSWRSSHAHTATLNGDAVAPNGSQDIQIPAAGTHTITVWGDGGTAQQDTYIDVYPLPSATLTVSKTSILASETITLNWASSHADSVLLNNRDVSHSGTHSERLYTSKQFNLVATGQGGSASSHTLVTVADYISNQLIVFC